MRKSSYMKGSVGWSAWGDWVWSKTYNRYYRQRQDNQGNIETDWGPVYDSGSEGDDGDDVPRQQNEDEVNDVAEQLENAGLDSGDEDTGSDDDQAPEYNISSSSHAQSSRTEKTKREKREKEKVRSKGKSREDERENPKDKHRKTKGKGTDKKSSRTKGRSSKEEEQEKDRKGKRRQHHDGSDNEPDEDDAGYGDYLDYGQRSTEGYPAFDRREGGSFSQQQGGLGTDDHDDGDDDGNDDEDVGAGFADEDTRRAINDSRQPGRVGGPSTGEYPPSESIKMNHDHIASGSELETVDPRYKVEPSYKFQPGEVFKVFWPEPTGESGHKAPSVSEKRAVSDFYGGRIYAGYRRFVVIGNDFGHCTCVPIFTYGGQACRKRGVKPEKHGIALQLGHKARLVPGEPRPGMPTVKVKMLAEGEGLAWQSRINYSKLITVEHNVKVFFIGRIIDEDYDHVFDSVNLCWEQKSFRKKRQ